MQYTLKFPSNFGNKIVNFLLIGFHKYRNGVIIQKKDEIQQQQKNQRHIDAEKFKGIRRQSKHPQHQKIYAHGRRIKNSQLRQIS